MAIEEHEGGCLCGAVRFRLSGEPSHGNVCHCSQCQKQTGAPYAAFVTYLLDRFTLIAGAPSGYRASEKVLREFCGACGSTLFWREDGEGDIGIFLGALDHPEKMPRPAYQLWVPHRLPWTLDLATVKAYERNRSDG
jgi:hypothetical protein